MSRRRRGVSVSPPNHWSVQQVAPMIFRRKACQPHGRDRKIVGVAIGNERISRGLHPVGCVSSCDCVTPTSSRFCRSKCQCERRENIGATHDNANQTYPVFWGQSTFDSLAKASIRAWVPLRPWPWDFRAR